MSIGQNYRGYRPDKNMESDGKICCGADAKSLLARTSCSALHIQLIKECPCFNIKRILMT